MESQQVDFAQTIRRENVGGILDLIEKIDKLDNVQKIIELLSR
jgi:hypothetical protein